MDNPTQDEITIDFRPILSESFPAIGPVITFAIPPTKKREAISVPFTLNESSSQVGRYTTNTDILRNINK